MIDGRKNVKEGRGASGVVIILSLILSKESKKEEKYRIKHMQELLIEIFHCFILPSKI